MIKIYPYSQLGHADHGWLDARHHFSFASYRNPDRIGFGKLLVINDDKIAAQTGFGTHPHNNMEIITYVRQGAITHQDSLGNLGRTAAGDVQVMSAGSGVRHSEHNLEHETTTLYQIWIEPNQANVEPRWDLKQFPKEPIADKLTLLVSGQSEHKDQDALFIYQDAAIYAGRLTKDTKISQNIKHQAYILLSQGSATINGLQMQKGDGAEVTQSKIIAIVADSDCEILIIDVPE
ncbi:MAG: pirin family protein [Pseudomonadota bacterium]